MHVYICFRHVVCFLQSSCLVSPFIPLHLPSRYLSDEDDGVSEAMISFAVQYIGVLKVHVHVHVDIHIQYF